VFIGNENAEILAGDLRDAKTARRALIGRHLEAESLSPTDFALRLDLVGIGRARVSALLQGEEPRAAELDAMAAVLSVRTSDFNLTPLGTVDSPCADRIGAGAPEIEVTEEMVEAALAEWPDKTSWETWCDSEDVIVRRMLEAALAVGGRGRKIAAANPEDKEPPSNAL
jgi:hypothetical protein